MKNINKILSIIIIISILILNCTAISATNTAKVLITAKASPDGKGVTVSATISSDSPIKSLSFNLKYDKALVKVKSSSGTIAGTEADFSNTAGNVKGSYDSKNAPFETGTLFTATFESLDFKTATNANFTVTVTSVVGADDEAISVGSASATVKVSPTIDTKITLNKTLHEMAIGNTFKLVATVKPTGKATFKSSNPKVVSVDANGNLKALSIGKSVITATSNEETATCNIEVKKEIKITKITIENKSYTMDIDDEILLKTAIEPENATDKLPQFVSSNPTIATVNAEGKVVAKKQGTVIITAQSKDKSVKTTCKIIVKPEIKINNLTIGNKDIKIKIGEEVTIGVAITPNNATKNDLIYSSSDTAVATIDKNGKVTGKASGFTTITVETKDGAISDQCVVTVLNAAVSENKMNVIGRLLDLKGKPIADRTIEISPSQAKVVTDKDGKFEFKNILKMDYTVYLYDKAGEQVEAKGTLLQGKNANLKIDIILNKRNLIISEQLEKPAVVVPIQKLSFATEKIRLKEKEEFQLVYMIEPKAASEQAVTFKSSNTSVVTVQQNGVIRGLSKGSGIITVMSSEGVTQAQCLVQIDGADSNAMSYLIIIVEMVILACLVLLFFLAYKRFKANSKNGEL